MYADAIISPADTGLIYTTVSSRVSYAMGKNGNAPAVLARNNKQGVPVIGLFLTFVVGLILFLPFPSWQQLVGFITTATVISFGSGPLVLAALRRTMPDRERPFRVWGGDAIPLLAFYSANMIVYWAGWDTNKKLFITVLIGYVFLAAFRYWPGNPRLPLDLRAGAPWVVPWLVGMALISWLGDPNRHPAAFNWVFLINAGFSVAIFYLAVHVRAGRDTIERHIEDAQNESAEEEAEVAGTGA